MVNIPSGLTKVNCVLNADFRGVSKDYDFRGVSEDNFKQRTRKDGSLYYEVHYNSNVTFDSTMIRFTSEMDEKEYGERLRPSIDPSETKRELYIAYTPSTTGQIACRQLPVSSLTHSYIHS